MKTTGLTIVSFTSALALFGASAVAFAADTPPPSAPTTTDTQKPPPADKTAEDTTQGDPNEKICKKVTVPDSRIPTTICLTRAEWAKPNE